MNFPTTDNPNQFVRRSTEELVATQKKRTSEVVVLSTESRLEFLKVFDAYVSFHEPRDYDEVEAVATMAACVWRIRRARLVKGPLIELDRLQRAIVSRGHRLDDEAPIFDSPKVYSKSLAAVTSHERRLTRMLHQQEILFRKERNKR